MSGDERESPGIQLGLVIPCYNESASLPITLDRLYTELSELNEAGLITGDSRIHIVDDGSTDDTWDIVVAAAAAGKPVVGTKLTRNFGHQHALFAGLMRAKGEALISMDADLQDDISAMRNMLLDHGKGNEIVYGVRRDRSSDSRFKRWTALAHYRVMEKMGIETIDNHADFRLMSRRAITLLSGYSETNLYLRGIIPHLGLQSSRVYFDRDERTAGVSKYNLWNMLGLAIKGITSFSIAPLRFISIMGFLIFTLSMLLGGWVLYAAIGQGGTIPGWASTVLPMYLLGGFQLLAIGIVGEYIGKSYMEMKRRPLFLVEQTIGENETSNSAHDQP